MLKKDAGKEFKKVTETKVKPETERKKSKKNKLIDIINYLNEKYEFKYNLFAKKPVYRRVGETNFEFLGEREFDNLYNEIEIDQGLVIPRTRLESLVGSNFISEDFDPIKDYLKNLPVWDGKDRIRLFLQQIQLKDESQREFLITYFTKWFVAVIASLIDDFAINEMGLVFTGEQGRGKTRFFTSLIPAHLRLHYLFVGSFNPRDKDHLEMMGTKILIFLDELETITRTDEATLKSVMSLRHITLRRAFGRGNIHLHRRASFAGSINDAKFLTDQSGNRRWLPFAIHDIQIDEGFCIDDLYAQALALWKNRYNIWFDRQEIEVINDHNEDFRRKPMEEDLVMLHYAIPKKDEIESNHSSLEYLTTTDLMHEIASKDSYRKMNTNDTVLKRIGKSLEKLGFQKVKKRVEGYANPREVWVVKPLGIEDINRIKRGNDMIPDNERFEM